MSTSHRCGNLLLLLLYSFSYKRKRTFSESWKTSFAYKTVTQAIKITDKNWILHIRVSLSILFTRWPILRCQCHVGLWRWRSTECSLCSRHIFRISLLFHWSPYAVDIQSMNVFLCVPLSRLPSITVSAMDSNNWFFLTRWQRRVLCARKLSMGFNSQLVRVYRNAVTDCG